MDNTHWRRFWEDKGRRLVSDHELDRGISRATDIERLSNDELLEFIAPKTSDVIFDAGCGTGANILLLHSKVTRIFAMDYADSAITRCKRRLAPHDIPNSDLLRGDVTALPLPSACVDKVLCLSVLQYLSDDEVRTTLAEFARILKPDGSVILHVKNLSSLYLSSLRAAKRILRAARIPVRLEYFRPYRWYIAALNAVGFHVVQFNSFNLLNVEGMPQSLVTYLQRMELRYRNRFPFRTALLRRHGSELKLKARFCT